MAEPVDVIRLWADGAPSPHIDIEGDEIAYVNPAGIAKGSTSIRNIGEPTLTVYAPEPGTANGQGVIVVPGGGWTLNMWTHEGVDISDWLCALGFTCFVLKYRVQQTPPDHETFMAAAAAMDQAVHHGGFTDAMKPAAISDLVKTEPYLAARAACADDGRRAIAFVRENVGRFNIDAATLGMIGFSAGAFLAVDIAVDPQAPQLAWVAAVYGGETCGKPVPADAPPLFSCVAQDDVLSKICTRLHGDWIAADRPSEHHAFARGQHGFGLVEQGMPSDKWTDMFLAWLRDL